MELGTPRRVESSVSIATRCVATRFFLFGHHRVAGLSCQSVSVVAWSNLELLPTSSCKHGPSPRGSSSAPPPVQAWTAGLEMEAAGTAGGAAARLPARETKAGKALDSQDSAPPAHVAPTVARSRRKADLVASTAAAPPPGGTRAGATSGAARPRALEDPTTAVRPRAQLSARRRRLTAVGSTKWRPPQPRRLWPPRPPPQQPGPSTRPSLASGRRLLRRRSRAR